MVRPVYLAVVGYLTAYLAQARLSLETQVLKLETAKERNRIARALHDGCVQTLGGINLTLENLSAAHFRRPRRGGARRSRAASDQHQPRPRRAARVCPRPGRRRPAPARSSAHR
ncbi:MAG: hypothetical protein E6J83_06905 [Deltaproteobacteria bacterium]|nr:MAG: hypothetical protein E6J83_06905 [Deltaproteobacteria bacterium]